MPDNSGFVDLRVGGQRGGSDDSVWPSFTDIMMVIVMIFLMALVVIMARNFELTRQLVTTTDASEASALENQSLVEKLAALELNVFGLEQSLETSVSERDQLTREKQQLAEQERLTGENLAAALVQVADLAAREARLIQELVALSEQFSTLELQSSIEIEVLSSANLSLSEHLDTVSSDLRKIRDLLETEQQQRRQLGAQVEEQNRELLDKQALLERLQLAQQQSAKRYADANAEIDNLNELIRRRLAENADLQKLADESGAKFRSLQEEYESLDDKYRSLVRPARSPAGKYVVDVRIDKFGNGYRYQLKEPQSDAVTYNTKAELELGLASIKEQKGRNLYTRVIIPAQSQISHNEAWRFTQEILQGYDYYSQKYPDDSAGDSATPQ